MISQAGILLHVCCAPCSTAVVERLRNQGYDVVLFFSNSNIYPEEEYRKRAAEAFHLASILDVRLEEDSYDHQAWLEHVHGLETEPERGRRCIKCFAYSLARTAARAQQLFLPQFTTTLSVSRHKSSRDIFEAGGAFPGFLAMDFKKQDGYARSVRLSTRLNLYRQGYCGCEFSMRQARSRNRLDGSGQGSP